MSLPNKNVFINCPFDTKYQNLFIALVAGLTTRGLLPRCILEIPQSQNRLDRLIRLISDCSYSVHDLSRVQVSNGALRCPRFNMPFELGLAIGLSKKPGFKHDFFIIESTPYRLQKSLSDLNGFDPYIHNNDPIRLLKNIHGMFEPSRNQKIVDIKSFETVYEGLRKAVRKDPVFKDFFSASSFQGLVYLSARIFEQLES